MCLCQLNPGYREMKPEFWNANLINQEIVVYYLQMWGREGVESGGGAAAAHLVEDKFDVKLCGLLRTTSKN